MEINDEMIERPCEASFAYWLATADEEELESGSYVIPATNRDYNIFKAGWNSALNKLQTKLTEQDKLIEVMGEALERIEQRLAPDESATAVTIKCTASQALAKLNEYKNCGEV